MKIYQRNISGRLSFLRFIFFAVALLCLVTFKDDYTNAGYFFAVTLVFLSLIRIQQLNIYHDHFEVKQYYLFGFLPISKIFHKKDGVNLEGFGSDFGNTDDEGFSDVESPAGLLFYFYKLVFGVKSRITHRKFSIRKMNDHTRFNSIELFLSKEEYELVTGILK